MKPAAYALCLTATLACAPAAAQDSRLPTPQMSCAQAQALVGRQGATVLYTGPHLYDRYVASLQFCPPRQDIQPAWVPAKDNAQCFIGYTCVEAEHDDW